MKDVGQGLEVSRACKFGASRPVGAGTYFLSWKLINSLNVSVQEFIIELNLHP